MVLLPDISFAVKSHFSFSVSFCESFVTLSTAMNLFFTGKKYIIDYVLVFAIIALVLCHSKDNTYWNSGLMDYWIIGIVD